MLKNSAFPKPAQCLVQPTHASSINVVIAYLDNFIGKTIQRHFDRSSAAENRQKAANSLFSFSGLLLNTAEVTIF